MNTLADIPVSGLAPEHSVQPAVTAATITEITAKAVPDLATPTWRRVRDILVAVYAYGLLAFGIFFPIVLAVWAEYFGPGAH